MDVIIKSKKNGTEEDSSVYFTMIFTFPERVDAAVDIIDRATFLKKEIKITPNITKFTDVGAVTPRSVGIYALYSSNDGTPLGEGFKAVERDIEYIKDQSEHLCIKFYSIEEFHVEKIKKK